MIEVVIPAHNAGRFLRETLLSVAAQSVLPSRVTVVDDASTDDTVAVAHACRTELQDRIAIQVVANPGPRGPSAARNKAIRESEAEWVALLDADDLLAPRHHELLLRAATAAPDVVLGFGDSLWFSMDEAGARRTIRDSFFAVSGVSGLSAAPVGNDSLTLGNATFSAMLDHGLFGTSACLFKRSAALAAGLFDETMMFSEDTDFFLRLALQGRFAFTRERTTFKRVHGGNLSQDRNNLAFSRGTVFSYAKLAADNRAALAPDQKEAVRQALNRATAAYLYNASHCGIRAYQRAARMARHVGLGILAAHPRHLLRVAWFTVVEGPRAQVPQAAE